MKVFVAGATGVLGARMVPLLVAAGHVVHGVARSESKAAWLRERGAVPVTVDLFDPEGVRRVVEELGPDAVVHTATHVPTMWSAGRRKGWALHDRLRSEATTNLLSAAVEAGTTVFVKDSVCFYYVDGGDTHLDEDADVFESPVTAASLAGERSTVAFTSAPSSGRSRRGVVLRFGWFYGAHTTGSAEAHRLAKLGLSPYFGRREDHWPMVHLDDAAAAVLAAIDSDAAGIHNVADDSVTKGENVDAYASAFSKRRSPLVVPTWTMRATSRFAIPVLAGSKRISSARFTQATGWTPTYPTPAEGWPAVAAAERRSEPTTEVQS